MKAMEILSEIKELLGAEPQKAEEAVELASAKLSNGTEIEAESFEAGQSVFIVTEDEKVALPVGEYEMEDGKVLVVSEEGVIAEMKDGSEAEEEAPAEEEVEAADEEKVEAEYVTKEEFAQAVNEIKAMIEQMMNKDEMSEEIAEVEVEAEKVEAPVQEMELAAEPIAHNPEGEAAKFNFAFQNNVNKTKTDRIKSILNKL